MSGDFEVTRQQLVIVGYVSDSAGRPVSHAPVELVAVPQLLAVRLPDQFLKRRLVTSTRADGYFGFCNLPDGTYTVAVQSRGQTVTQEALVQRDEKSNIAFHLLEFVFPAVGVSS